MTTQETKEKKFVPQPDFETRHHTARIVGGREPELLSIEGADSFYFNYDEARALRDWLNKVLPDSAHEPPVVCGPELAHAMDKLGAIVNGQSEHITPIEANALLINWRQLQSDARAAQPPRAWRSALLDKPTESDGPVVLVFTGEAYSVEYPEDVNSVEHIAWCRITPYTRPTKEVR